MASIKQKRRKKIVFFSRKPRGLGNFSVETYFSLVRHELMSSFDVEIKTMPYESNGVLKRIANAVYCMFHQGDVNHITGDIHYVALLLKKSKTILTILDCGLLHENKGIKRLIFKLLWYTLPAKKSSVITAISEATRQDLIACCSIPAKKIKVVYVCINPTFKRTVHEFNADSPRILHIGTAPNKNLSGLIEALAGIPCRLVVIGKVDDRIRELINLSGIQAELIERKLSQDEIVNEYNKCDILSQISFLEGFGMPIVEANVTGRVVITSNITSMPEVAGKAALFVDPYDRLSIHNGFKRIINDSTLRHELIEEGYRNAERFNASSIASEFRSIYNKILHAG